MWKKIEGFSGYSVSTEGKVRNDDTGRVLSENPNEKGYMKVNLCIDGKSFTRKNHKLVAQMFIDNPEDYDCVDHINEDKSDNSVDNLRWCTHQQNIDFYYENHPDLRSEPKPKMSRSEYIKTKGKSCKVNGRIFHSAGSAAKMISEIEGKNQSTISKEIRRMLQGKREPWCMYGKYDIDVV